MNCLARVTAHEIGHSLGLLEHSPQSTDLMFAVPVVRGAFGPRPFDCGNAVPHAVRSAAGPASISAAPPARLVTEQTVREAAGAGRGIVTDGSTVVTPAARDLARQLGVPLQIQEARTIALGSDHGGYRLKEALKPIIEASGFRMNDVGCNSTDPVDYPIYAARVAELVGAKDATYGIMVDGAGIGSAMVANKIKGVRAALCYDLTTARNAREHNNANMLTLGGGLIGERLALDIVKTFLTTDFAGGRHAPRVAMIDALDR